MDAKIRENINTIANVAVAIIAIVSIFISISLAHDSNKLATRVIELTPSKYAYLDISLSQYLGKVAYFSYSQLERAQIYDDNKIRIGLNIINTGSMDTDNITLRDGAYDNIDTTMHFGKNILIDTYDLGNLRAKENNIFWLYLSIYNYTEVIGLHPVKLRVSCHNCLDQGVVIYKDFFVCIYNQTRHNQDIMINRDCDIKL